MNLVDSSNTPLTDNEKYEALLAKKSGMTTTVLPTAVEENFSQYSSGGGITPLMQACQQGHESSVRQLLHKDSRIVHERDRTGKTALHYCAENSSLTCIDQILAADPSLLSARDEDGYTPLHLATIAGNRSVVRYLLTKGSDVHATDNEKHTAVHWATVCGEVELLELLIESGGNPSTPDIHGAYPIHYAAQMCGPNSELGQDVQTGLLVLQKLLQYGVDVSVKDQDGRQPLLWAASAEVRPSHVYCPSGSADAILALVNAGADVTSDDKDGLTALHCAASRGHLDCLDVLITLCSAEVDTLDANGCTPLFYAATLGHADCTDLLLKHGSIPDRQDRKGRTPAHCGAAKGQLETLKLLHKRGADLWKRNVKGDLPLHEAIQSGRKDLVMWLLSLQPISVNAPNNDGRCPLHIAAINNNTEMCKIIMDYKASVNPIMRNSRGQLLTPVDAAVARGNKGCAKYLQLHGGLPAIRLTDKRALQAAMQRALEFEPSGHTGATPSDLTGDLTETSSPTMSKTPFFLEIPPALLVGKNENTDGGGRSSSSIGLQMGYPYEQIDSGSQTESGTPGLTGPETFTSESYIRDLILKEEAIVMTDITNPLEDGKHSEFEKGETVVIIENQNRNNESLIQESKEESSDATTVVADSISKVMTTESESVKTEESQDDSGESISKDENHESEEKEERDDVENDSSVNTGDDCNENENSKNYFTNGHHENSVLEDKEETTETKVNQTDNEKKEVQRIITDSVDDSQINVSAINGLENDDIAVTKVEVVLKSEEKDINNEEINNGSEAIKSGKRKMSKEKVSAGKKVSSSEDKKASNKVSLESKEEDRITESENILNKSSTVKTNSSYESCHSEDSLDNSFQKENKSLLLKDSKVSGKKSLKIKKASQSSKSQSDDELLKENVMKGQTKINSESEEVLTTPSRELGDGASEDGESLANTENSLSEKVPRTKILRKKSSSKFSNGSSKVNHSTSGADRSSSQFTPSPVNTNEEASDLELNDEYSKENIESSSHSSVETVLPFQNGDLKIEEDSTIQDKGTLELLLTTATSNNVGFVQGVLVDSKISTPTNTKQRKSILKKRSKSERTHELHLTTSNGDNNIGLVEDFPVSSAISTPKFSKQDIPAIEKLSLEAGVDKPINDSSENSDEDHVKGRVKNRRKTKKISKQKIPQRNEDGSLQQSDDSSYETSNENMQVEANSKAIRKKKDLVPRKIDMDTEKERLLKDFNQHDEEEEGHEDEVDVAPKDVDQNKTKTKEIRKRTTTKRGRSVKIDVGKRSIGDSKEDIKEAGRRVMSGGPKKVESIDSNMKKKRSALSLPMDMSVTRAMQTNVRKYALERRLFQQLLDLKRMQIRNSRANEHMLIKRMIDEYGNDEMIGLKSYVGAYNFANYEKYLYDQLRTLQATDNTKIPHFKSNDDVEKLTRALRKANVPELNEPIEILINKEREREKDYYACNQSTHRCHHAIHAYTGVPCAAYLAQYRRNEQRSKGALPQVGASVGASRNSDNKKGEIGMTKTTYDPKKPLTVQLQHGSAKQQISLPTNFLDNTRKYQLTVSIQPSGAARLQGIKTKPVLSKDIKKDLKENGDEIIKDGVQKTDEGPNSVRSAPELNKDAVQSVDDGPNSVRSAPDLTENSTVADDKNFTDTSLPEFKEDSLQKFSEESSEQVSPESNGYSSDISVENPSVQINSESIGDSLKENAANPITQPISVAKKSSLQKVRPNNSLKPSPIPSTEPKASPLSETKKKKPILKKVSKETSAT